MTRVREDEASTCEIHTYLRCVRCLHTGDVSISTHTSSENEPLTYRLECSVMENPHRNTSSSECLSDTNKARKKLHLSPI